MNIKEKIQNANNLATRALIQADPQWIGVEKAIDCIDGFEENLVLHSGPPIDYEDMCELHKQGMRNAVLLEGFAKTETEAENLILRKKIKIDSALNYNTVGSGTGIITRSVPLLVVQDKNTLKKAGVFPHEGKFGGGFCGWGVYSEEIKDNLAYMHELFADVNLLLKDLGGFPLKDIIANGLEMGDEIHSSQTAVDALFIRKFIPLALQCKNSEELLRYFASSNRFFHNFGQASCKSAILSSIEIPYSTMVTAAGGNGVEYGIQVAGLDGWFTAPSPMIRGRYMVENASEADQLPWIGDSSIVEVFGLGGLSSAASPKVCSWRNQTAQEGITLTESMYDICISEHTEFKIPQLNYRGAPAGIDILKVYKTGILPVINGGMINRKGGWIGAGCARIPLECFQKAITAYAKKYKIRIDDLC